jgi:hypothetical protein
MSEPKFGVRHGTVRQWDPFRRSGVIVTDQDNLECQCSGVDVLEGPLGANDRVVFLCGLAEDGKRYWARQVRLERRHGN